MSVRLVVHRVAVKCGCSVSLSPSSGRRPLPSGTSNKDVVVAVIALMLATVASFPDDDDEWHVFKD